MSDTGYVIWFIATTLATVSIMALGIAASAGAFRRDKAPQAGSRPHLRLIHHRGHDQRHHAA